MNGLVITQTAIQVRAYNLMKIPEFIANKLVDFAKSVKWCKLVYDQAQLVYKSAYQTCSETS